MKRFIFAFLYTMHCFFCGYAQQQDSIIYNTATLLVQADSMPVNQGQLMTLPHQGLFIVDGNTLYSLDKESCPSINKIRLLENFPFEQIIINDNEFVIKSQQFMMLMGEERTEILTEFDTEDYTLFPGGDSIINIVMYEDFNNCSWHKFDRRTGKVECILKQTEPIKKIVAGNQIDFCIIGDNVYYVKDDVCDKYIVSEKPIIDMLLLPNGLMFCTDDTLSIISDDTAIPLLEGDFHGLHYDGNFVYIVIKNGNIWRLR